MLSSGTHIWFIAPDKRVYSGTIIGYNVEVIDKFQKITYTIDAIVLSYPIRYEHQDFEDIEEMYIFFTEEDAVVYRDSMLTKPSKNVSISLDYTQEELNELEETLSLLRELLINNFRNIAEAEKHLDNLDDLISAISINKCIERFV